MFIAENKTPIKEAYKMGRILNCSEYEVREAVNKSTSNERAIKILNKKIFNEKEKFYWETGSL